MITGDENIVDVQAVSEIDVGGRRLFAGTLRDLSRRRAVDVDQRTADVTGLFRAQEDDHRRDLLGRTRAAHGHRRDRALGHRQGEEPGQLVLDQHVELELGQPQPESYFVSELNRGWAQPAQR